MSLFEKKISLFFQESKEIKNILNYELKIQAHGQIPLRHSGWWEELVLTLFNAVLVPIGLIDCTLYLIQPKNVRILGIEQKKEKWMKMK